MNTENSNIYKEASKINLTYTVPKVGTVSFIDLWSLSLTVLDQMATELHSELDSSNKFSLLNPKKTDKVKELQFAILVDIVQTRQEEELLRKQRQADYQQRQAKRQLLLEAIAAKENNQVMEMSLEDLQAQLAELD